ncbi:MAG: pyridoxamine 5'-phosphate oxidase [Verrucomicrobiales bacterium]|nr:pyridoxamine 5'-phosphate oxidase [Verrucomicrobiales bacterium]
MRQDYQKESLSRGDAAPDPLVQFRKWFAEAKEAEILEPNAMVLATVDAAGRPASRTVLLKGIDARGFTFFTSYESRKGRELAANPRAAVTFLWLELQRQVNICGIVEFVSEAESDAYFQVRPQASQIGALASAQSSVIPSRHWIEERFAALQQQYPEGSRVPRPQYWGGYLLVPESIEFWQGRPSRLHDRILYQRDSKMESGWTMERLSP